MKFGELRVRRTQSSTITEVIEQVYLHNYSENFEVVQNSCEIIERGIDISIISKISFLDALILASAEYSKCSVVITEGLNDGQIINGIRIINPFIIKKPNVV